MRREDSNGQEPNRRFEPARNMPVHEVQFGRVRASVWENTSRSGKVYHKVSIRRVETNGDETWLSNSFFPEDLKHVAQAATASRIWLLDSRDEVPAGEEKAKKRRARRKPEAASTDSSE